MNKEQLLAENILLRQQVEQLTNQAEELLKLNSLNGGTETNLNWKELVGRVWNESGKEMINRAQLQSNSLTNLQKRQGLLGKKLSDNEAPIAKWSPIHAAQLAACQAILNNPEAVHAVCEVRERKRNNTLGLLPTVSELYEIITAPEPNTRPYSASDKTAELYEFFEPGINLSR